MQIVGTFPSWVHIFWSSSSSTKTRWSRSCVYVWYQWSVAPVSSSHLQLSFMLQSLSLQLRASFLVLQTWKIKLNWHDFAKNPCCGNPRNLPLGVGDTQPRCGRRRGHRNRREGSRVENAWGGVAEERTHEREISVWLVPFCRKKVLPSIHTTCRWFSTTLF
jgi:hypothetical protein